MKQIFAFPLAALGVIGLLPVGNSMITCLGLALLALAALALAPQTKMFSVGFICAAVLIVLQLLSMAGVTGAMPQMVQNGILALQDLGIAALGAAFLLGVVAIRRKMGEGALLQYALLLVFCAGYLTRMLISVGGTLLSEGLLARIADMLPMWCNVAAIGLILALLAAQRDLLQSGE